MAAPRHILDGYKVLDFTQYIAGPTAPRMMAGMGAEIVKVEIVPAGDRTRELPLMEEVRKRVLHSAEHWREKYLRRYQECGGYRVGKGTHSEGRCISRKFRMIARMGFDYATVKALNPKIVMCSISTFGQQGPLAHLPGYDFIAQAYSGIT